MSLLRRDYLGNAVTAADQETVEAIDDFVGGFLGYETRAANIIPTALARPECCLANVFAGALCMFLESPEAPARAEPYLRAAKRAASGATDRERAWVELLEAWAAKDGLRSKALANAIVDAHPRDLAAVKLGQYFDFNRGDFPGMLRIALKALPHAADVAHLHGMLAFAYEQCELLSDAEAAGWRALGITAREPWAQHALAHVMITQGRIDEGARFLETASSGWTDLNSFMLTHNWWHLALFYLSQGRKGEALSLYDTRIWGVCPDYSQDQVGAVSLLARLELAGADVGARWRELAPWLAAREADTVQPFLSLQYLYGLARAGRAEASSLFTAIRREAETALGDGREVWRDVVLPAAEGLLAHIAGDFRASVRRLGEALPRMAEIGGSHAQRDLFEQVHLDALIRAGRLVRAQQVLERRRATDPDGVPVNRALAGVYAALDLPEQARQAAQRARVRA